MVTHKKLILLVEDHVFFRMDITELLTNSGFDVLDANNAIEAMSLLNLGNNRVDLLFTDVQLPGGLDGVELAHYFRSCFPLKPILVSSGKIDITAEDLPIGSRFIRKPFGAEFVLSHIEELISLNPG